MATIQSLRKSISEMEDQEAISLLRRLRTQRFVIPARRVEIVKSKKEATVSGNKRMVNVLQAMSSEERQKLITMLEES